MKTQSPLIILAEWMQSRSIEKLPSARFDRIKQHILDTVGARLAGSRTREGAAIARVAASIRDPLYASVLMGCAQARCTEVDDIHLASCTTPGSVIVPTVLAFAAQGALRSVGECCLAALAGYEALIRFGLAIDGPSALHRQIWPTHAAAAFGSAATASRALRLNLEQTAGALRTALAFGSGPPVSGVSPASSRWLTLGIAAANGVLAARGAFEGVIGSMPTVPSPRALAEGLGRRCRFDEVGLKPFPTARQGLAAIEAVRIIAARERLQADEIDAIEVRLPQAQRAIVDRAGMPATRFESIVSLQYQIALTLTAPDRLLDVERTPPFESPDLRRLLSRIRLRRARELDSRYPMTWPASVEIRARGRRFTRSVMYPLGDARRPFRWEQVADKFVLLAAPAIGDAGARQAAREVRRAGPKASMPALWDLS